MEIKGRMFIAHLYTEEWLLGSFSTHNKKGDLIGKNQISHKGFRLCGAKLNL